MTDILFSHSYFLRFDPKQWKAQQPFPPLATLFAASFMRQNKYTVALFDTMFSRSPEELTAYLEKHKPRFFVIYDDGFNYLTKMCLTNMREAAFDMLSIAKKNGCKVILSSSDSTDHSMDYLNKGADFIVYGEGENTLLETINQLSAGGSDFSAIHGLRYLVEGEEVKTSPRSNLRELDVLPLPAWDLVDMDEYRQRWLKSSGYFTLNVATTRGCPFKCNWCAKPIYGNRYNSRSPENVLEELLMLKSTYDFDHIWFCDDIFGLKPGWVNRFADLVQENKLEFKFKIQSRADLLLQENNVAALARAGADEVWIGAESGSQKILDAMDKGTTVGQIVESTQMMKKHGIKPCYFLQFGYPGETLEDVHLTLDLVIKNMPHDIGVSVSYPLPGTKFFDSVKSQLSEKQNWNDSDELLVMFESPMPKGYYKTLQRHLHHEFRKRQAFVSLKNLGGSSDFRKALSLVYRVPQSALSKFQMAKYA
jgi:anaerobic magnesium-protoporphyrin IX monomethyl ester cyclase